MKFFASCLLLFYSINCVNSQFGLLDLLNTFNPLARFGTTSKLFSCPFHRCRNVNNIDWLLERRLSPNFQYHHLQHLRRPDTQYTLYGTNEGPKYLNLALSGYGKFLAYDSDYDPVYDPCSDCDDSGRHGKYCERQKCYIERTFLIGQN